MTESLQLIVHGKQCPEWTEPTTVEDWKSLQLVHENVDADGIHQVWRCPQCGTNVIFMMDHGTIDFGNMDLEADGADDWIESFQAVVRYEGVDG